MVTVCFLLVGHFSGIDLDATPGAFTPELTHDGAAGAAADSLFCCASV